MFSALRAYASSGENKILGCFVLVLSLAPVGGNLVGEGHAVVCEMKDTDHFFLQVKYKYKISGLNDPHFGCLARDHITDARLALRYGLTTPLLLRGY